MILDNVDDAELIRPILPATNGCVLVTTRYKEVAREIQAKELFELHSLNEDRSLEMFQGLRKLWNTGAYQPPTDDEVRLTKEFLRELDGLPLAIEQMAAYAAFKEKTIHQLHQDFTRSFRRIAGGITKK